MHYNITLYITIYIYIYIILYYSACSMRTRYTHRIRT